MWTQKNHNVMNNLFYFWHEDPNFDKLRIEIIFKLFFKERNQKNNNNPILKNTAIRSKIIGNNEI